MCETCQQTPRVIDYAITCKNCGNLHLLDCKPDNPESGEICDLWVPEDHFNYDHHVNFILPDIIPTQVKAMLDRTMKDTIGTPYNPDKMFDYVGIVLEWAEYTIKVATLLNDIKNSPCNGCKHDYTDPTGAWLCRISSRNILKGTCNLREEA